MEREDVTEETRRRFVVQCGRLALAAPPTLALLLTPTDRGYAVAGSVGYPGHGSGKGHGKGKGGKRRKW